MMTFSMLASAQAWCGDMEAWRYNMMGDMGGGWGMGFGLISMILFWGLVILGIAALAKWLMQQSSSGGSPRDKTPLEILQERYVRGEIDREKYEQKRQDLMSHR
jgi:putative membrane protein